MNKRTKSTITLYLGSNTLEIPITPSSAKRYKLMEEDSVILKFSHPSAIMVGVGDRIVDEIFGTYYSKDKQYPTYNTSTGAYDYELTFVHPAFLLCNQLFMLTTSYVSNRTTFYRRKEVSWNLTASLKTHAQQIAFNILALAGQVASAMFSSVRIYLDTENLGTMGEAHSLSFNSISILQALKNICESYECEFWFTTTRVSRSMRLNIFIGKCENTDIDSSSLLDTNVYSFTKVEKTPLVITEGENAEKVSVQRNQVEYANRLYAFGSDKNVPQSYRKKLELEVTAKTQSGNSYIFFDGMHHIKERMSNKVLSAYSSSVDSSQSGSSVTPMPTISVSKTFNVSSAQSMAIIINLDLSVSTSAMVTAFFPYSTYKKEMCRVDKLPLSRVFIQLDCTIIIDGEQYKKETLNIGNSASGSADYISINKSIDLADYGNKKYLSQGNHTIEVRIDNPAGEVYMYQPNSAEITSSAFYAFLMEQFGVDNKRQFGRNSVTYYTDETMSSQQTEYYFLKYDIGLKGDIKLSANEEESNPFMCSMKYNGADYYICFNPDRDTIGMGNYYGFKFCDNSGNEVEPPSGFDIGSKFIPYLSNEDPEYGLKVTRVPFSYYVSENDNPSSVLSVSSKRLALPMATCPNGFVGSSLVGNVKLKETSVIFDKIYPRATFYIKEVYEQSKKQKVEYEDGSVYSWTYSQFAVKLAMINSEEEFVFDDEAQMEGKALNLTFITLSELTDDERESRVAISQESNLAGMTFECNHVSGKGDSSFDIIINDTYGAQLPNNELRPKVGDICVLTNWDVRAISSGGFIDNAEQRLEAKALAYIEELNKDQIVCTCAMNSADIIKQDWNDNAGLRMVQGQYISLKGSGENYDLPTEGRSVVIKSDTFIDGEFRSRVIGYEFKLDIPYDSPTYTCGETEAYSRLKKLEKEITKLQ